MLVCSPLLVAARLNDVDSLQHLLENGADPNTCAENGATAVYVAAEQGNAGALRVLLEQGGADVDTPLSGGCGFTPVYVASLRNHTIALEMLLQHGADPNVTICGMLRPMDVAAKMQNEAAVALLQEYGGEPLKAAVAQPVRPDETKPACDSQQDTEAVEAHAVSSDEGAQSTQAMAQQPLEKDYRTWSGLNIRNKLAARGWIASNQAAQLAEPVVIGAC